MYIKEPEHRITKNSKGDTFYFRNDKLHRLEGPAVVCHDGTVEYWINGQVYDENEFQERLNKIDRLKQKHCN